MGIEAGKNANIKVIALKDHYFGQDQSKADFIFEDLGEVLEFLQSKMK